MQKQKKYFKSFFILSGMILFLFGFNTTEVLAVDPPSTAEKGKLPIPGTSKFSDDLTLSQAGTILENGETQLVWTEDGDLQITYYNKQVLWSSETAGRASTTASKLNFHNDGRLVIEDNKGQEIWSFGFWALDNKNVSGDKLVLKANRNLELQSSTGEIRIETGTTMPVLETDKMNTITRLGNYGQDYMVPLDIDKKYITIRAEGADGGKRQVKETWGATRFTVNGGAGATVKATFKIGTGSNQIPPGAVLRVILGEKGPTQTTQEDRGCAGGGGTGVFYKEPGHKSWKLLMVAGGGGGAYSTCCGNKHTGYPAEVSEGGGRGSQSKSDNHSGQEGHSASNEYGGVGVLHDSSVDSEWGIDSIGWPNGSWNDKALPTGGKWTYNKNGLSGTWGFGGGGPRQPLMVGGGGAGGGGGYSGGSEAAQARGAGGGGSYMAKNMEAYQVQMIKNSNTADTQHGFVSFKFTNNPGTTVKTINLTAATNKCVTNTDGVMDNDNNIQVSTCEPVGSSQHWIYSDYRLQLSYNNKKCMDVKNHGTSNGTNVRIWDCMDHNEQRWFYDGLTKQFRSFLNLDKCLDAALTSGSNVKLWSCSTTTHQQWEVTGATTISNPTEVQYIVPVKATNLAVHSHTGAESGSNIQLWDKVTGNAAEKWYFDGLAIKIKSNSSFCINLDGSNISLEKCNDTKAQQWVYNGISKHIHSVADKNKCMEVQEGNFVKRANIQIAACDNVNRQKFNVVQQ